MHATTRATGSTGSAGSTRSRLALLVLLGSLPCLAGPARAELRDTRRIERSFPAAGVRELVVDNVFGSIRVAAGPAGEIRMVASETVTAETPAAAAAARREVELEVREEPGRIVLYVDGPFRDDCGEGRRWDPAYQVTHDFAIQAPSGVHLTLTTVNGGEVSVRGARGGFDVENVNGGIELLTIAGSGHAATVNGPVRAVFTAPPSGEASFKTVNGDVEVELPEDLAADVRFKTQNGGIFTDFAYTFAEGSGTTAHREDGRFTLRLEKAVAIRVGGGGPALRLETLNGDLILRQANSRASRRQRP